MGAMPMRDLGSFVYVATSIDTTTVTGGSVAALYSTPLDRLLHNLPYTCVLHVHNALPSASGTFVGVFQLWHATASTTFSSTQGALYTDGAGNASTLTVTATAAADNQLGINLDMADEFIGAVMIVAGSSVTSTDTCVISARIILGGEYENAAI